MSIGAVSFDVCFEHGGERFVLHPVKDAVEGFSAWRSWTLGRMGKSSSAFGSTSGARPDPQPYVGFEVSPHQDKSGGIHFVGFVYAKETEGVTRITCVK